MTTTSAPLPPSRARARRLALFAAAALALPLAACGSSSDSSSGGSSDPAKAVLPSAPFYLEATVRPSGRQRADLEAAGRKILGTSDPGAKIRQLIDRAGSKDGKSYDKDIKPWLGDRAAVAVTGVVAGKAQFEAVIDSADDAKANDLLAGDSSYPTKRSFEGTDYRYDPSDGTAAAVIDHYVVIASEPVFKQVAHLLDKGGDSLATNVDLAAARDKVGGQPGFMFVNVPSLVRSAVANTPSSLGPGGLSALDGVFKSFRAIGVGIGADAQAIRMDIASIGSGAAAGSGPGTALPLEQAPGGAWLAIAQKSVGASLARGLGAGGTGSDILTQIETATGLNVKTDLLSWMGDATIFVEGDSVPTLGGALVVQSTDPARARAAITKIKGLLNQFNQRAGAAPAGTSPGFTLSLGPGKPTVQIGLAGSRFVIAVGRRALHDAIHPSSTLGANPTFRGASGLLGSTTKPSFYVNFRTVTRFLTLAAHNDASFAKAKPYLDAFTALIGGGSGGGRAQVAIGLK